MTSFYTKFTLLDLTFIYNATGLCKKMLYIGKNIYEFKKVFLFINTYLI